MVCMVRTVVVNISLGSSSVALMQVCLILVQDILGRIKKKKKKKIE